MASNQPAYAPAPARGATGTTEEPAGADPGFAPFGSYRPDLPPQPQPAFQPSHELPPELPSGPGFASGHELPSGPGFASGHELPQAPSALPAHQDVPAQPEPAPGFAPAAEPQTRLPRQRNVALGGTVLGMAAMAAVGAAGVAAAATPAAPAPAAGPAPVSVPDRAPEPEPMPPHAVVPAAAPAAVTSPAAVAAPVAVPAAVPVTEAVPVTAAVADDAAPAPVDPGEALRTRIIGQAVASREAVAQAARDAEAKVAAEQAAREAAAQKVRDQAAAAKAAAEARTQADAEAAARAETERLAQLAASYIKPVASYTLTNAFGEADPWSNLHTGQDFTAPTGTPVHAVHSGTVTSAGWAGAHGYRVVLTLDDGTQLWYCHLSTMVATGGRVTTGDTIGRVGATGNVPAPHLHLEVRPGGAAPVDPVPWLLAHDVTV